MVEPPFSVTQRSEQAKFHCLLMRYDVRWD
jgi:hypothetical protein